MRRSRSRCRASSSPHAAWSPWRARSIRPCVSTRRIGRGFGDSSMVVIIITQLQSRTGWGQGPEVFPLGISLDVSSAGSPRAEWRPPSDRPVATRPGYQTARIESRPRKDPPDVSTILAIDPPIRPEAARGRRLRRPVRLPRPRQRRAERDPLPRQLRRLGHGRRRHRLDHRQPARQARRRGRRRPEEHRVDQEAIPRREGLPGLARAARQGEAPRLGQRLDPGPHARPDHHAGAAARAATSTPRSRSRRRSTRPGRSTRVAREKKLVTQMGIQIHSHEIHRTIVATIQAGAIGKVKEVHSWSGKHWGDTQAPARPQGPGPGRA